MAKCEVRLVLDDERPVPAGGVIRGRVDVEVDGPMECRALRLELEWYTHGRGTDDSGRADEQVLFAGSWNGAGRRSYRFEVQVPEKGPVTHIGRCVGVEWRLRASADLAWRLDPKDSRRVVVVPRRRSPDERPPSASEAALFDLAPPLASELPARLSFNELANNPAALGCIGLFLLPFLVIGLAHLGKAAAALYAGELAAGATDAADLLATGVIFVGFPLVTLGLFLHRRLASARLRPMLLLSPVAYPGGEMEAELELEPKSDVALAAIEAELVCRERATDENATEQTGAYQGRGKTYVHVRWRQPLEVLAPPRLPGGTPWRTHIRARLPDDACPSFRSEHNAIEWSLSVKVKVKRGPDWADAQDFFVHP